jgi:hypothetical protein
VIVALTVSCWRQRYLRASVDSWARARGAEEASFLFCLEPPSTFPLGEFTEYVQRLFPGRAEVLVSEERLGCLRNTWRAMSQALARTGDGFAVVCEEDVEVADDILEYFAWARDAYREDPKVAVACAHARSSQVADPHAVVRASWFCPLGWGIWQDRWGTLLSPAWGPLDGSNNNESWDNNLKQLLQDTELQAVFPVRSRSLHIGELSVLMGPVLGEHVYQASVSDCFSKGYPPGSFHEVPYPEGGQLWV